MVSPYNPNMESVTTARDHRVCPVCKSEEIEVLFHPSQSPGTVSKCKQCGMVYVSDIENISSLIFDGPVVTDEHLKAILNSSNLDDIKQTWEYQFLPMKEAEAPALKQNSQQFLRKLDELKVGAKSNPKRIMDLGSGWGFFLAEAKNQGWDAYGLEPLPSTAVYSRAKFGLQIKIDTLRKDSYPPAYFDAITAFQVFEHLPFPDRDLVTLRGMLKPGGMILIEVPNFDTWTMNVLKGRHRHFVQDHLNFFGLKTIKEFVERNGFKARQVWRSSRYISLRYLVEIWGGRIFPAAVRPTRAVLRRLGLWDKVLRLNVGDIVAVIAEKT